MIDQLLPGLRKDQVFELIFRNGGSDILLEVHRRRGTDDLEIGDWEQLVQPPQQQELADQRQQQQLPPLVLFTRKLSYKYSFNGGILGSMSTVCSEQQTIMYQDSSRFVVESVSKTPFVPQ